MILEGTRTEHGIYCPSPMEGLDKFAQVIRGKRFLDIGSGYGGIVERAQELGANAYGVEVNEELYRDSTCRDKIFHKDVFDMDLTNWDVLYYYLGGCNRECELFHKILREHQGYTILYSG